MKLRNKILGGLAGLAIAFGASNVKAAYIDNFRMSYLNSPVNTTAYFDVISEDKDAGCLSWKPILKVWEHDGDYLGSIGQSCIRVAIPGQIPTHIDVPTSDYEYKNNGSFSLDISSLLEGLDHDVYGLDLKLSSGEIVPNRTYQWDTVNHYADYTIPASVPEPATIGLLGLGSIALLGRKKL